MTTPLPSFKPLSLGQILDQAIRVYRKNFFRFIGIIAMVQIPLVLLQLVSSLLTARGLADMSENVAAPTPPDNFGALFSGDYLLGMGATLMLALIAFILVQGIATAALTKAISDSYLGETTSIGGAYRKIRHDWGGLLVAMLLLALLNLVFAIWMFVPCVGWVTGPGLIAFSALGIGQLLAPVVVLEKIGGGAALRRAWELTRRRFWWVVGFIVLLFVFGQVIMTGPSLLLNYLGQLFFGFSTDPGSSNYMLQAVLQSILNLTLGLIYLPLQISAMTLLYYDLRVRTEGFDIAMLTYQEENAPLSLDEITATSTTTNSKELITGAEVGNFVLLSIAAGVVYTVILGGLLALNFFVLMAAGYQI